MPEISLRAAADLLRVDPSTIKRQIGNGTLEARMAPTPQGRRCVVTLPDLERPTAGGPEIAREDGLTAALRDEVQYLRRELDRRHDAEGELRVLLLRRDDEIERLHEQAQRLLAAPPALRQQRRPGLWWRIFGFG